jgi:predicted metalloprotease with PDZ domain
VRREAWTWSQPVRASTSATVKRLMPPAEQFRKAAEDVAGADLRAWFQKAVGSTEELNYAEALDWFGLRFTPGGEAKIWRLEVREDATAAQRGRLKAWLEPAAR